MFFYFNKHVGIIKYDKNDSREVETLIILLYFILSIFTSMLSTTSWFILKHIFKYCTLFFTKTIIQDVLLGICVLKINGQVKL